MTIDAGIIALEMWECKTIVFAMLDTFHLPGFFIPPGIPIHNKLATFAYNM